MPEVHGTAGVSEVAGYRLVGHVWEDFGHLRRERCGAAGPHDCRTVVERESANTAAQCEDYIRLVLQNDGKSLLTTLS